MGMRLAVSLSITQVEVANRLYRRLSLWQITDSAMLALQNRFPGFDMEASLLKVAALNQLYGTNVYAVGRIAHRLPFSFLALFLVKILGRIADSHFLLISGILPLET